MWVGAAQAVVLRAQSTTALSNVPAAVAARDMNWNFTPDLVVANSAANSITVLANNGSTNLGPIVDYAVGTGPAALALADFSGDGYIDIAVANQGSNNISILNNKAVAGVEFNAAVAYTVGSGPVAIAAGLLNNDLFNDLVVVNQAANSISVLFNNGAGAFSSTVSYSVGSSPAAVVAADFNGDGALDLAVANKGSNSVSLLLNDGAGLFATPMGYSAGSAPAAIAVLDVDRNGSLDIAVANSSVAAVSWLSNDGHGVFSFVDSYSVGATPSSLVATDMNGDGYDDLATANAGASSISQLESSRNGAFAAAVTAAVGTTPAAIIAADFDVDGDNDLAVVNSGSSTLSLLMNDTDFRPDDFPFIAQVDAPLSAVVESNVVTLSGMTGWGEITVSGGEYAVSSDGGVVWSAWSTTSPTAVTAGDQIKLRTTASAAGDVVVTVQVTIGGVRESFSVTTTGDAAPDPFVFIDQGGVAQNTLITSAPITVTGIDIGAPITVVGGMYRVNGGAYTTAPGVVSNNDTVQLRVTSSPLNGGVVNVPLTIGGLSDTFTVTTMAASEAGSGGGGALELPVLILMLLTGLLPRLSWQKYRSHMLCILQRQRGSADTKHNAGDDVGGKVHTQQHTRAADKRRHAVAQ
jgi:hypothetical protein